VEGGADAEGAKETRCAKTGGVAEAGVGAGVGVGVGLSLVTVEKMLASWCKAA
jgi:hypothetical protein